LFSFYDKESRLKGFKDSVGSIVIEPKFKPFTADKFDKIIVAHEVAADKSVDTYYLLRSGKKFGGDSIYMFDFIFPCESEGYIVFEDKATGLLGMFDAQGKAAIPAEYNAISQVKNGLFVGLKNAKKESLNHGNEAGCNHFKWVGGTSYLVNTKNEIQIEDFKYNGDLNWHSLQISDTITSDSIRVNFKGKKGNFFSFIDNRLEFDHYLDTLLTNLTVEKLYNNSFDRIVCADSGWISLPKYEYYEKHSNKVIRALEPMNKLNFKSSTSISSSIVLPDNLEYILENRKDNCGGLKKGEYPIYSLSINHIGEKGEGLSQDRFHFMKFDDKIKLISTVVRSK